MRLFIISALIAVSAAARLDHLEAGHGGNHNGATSNQYVPPLDSGSDDDSNDNGHGSHGNSFGSHGNGLGSHGNGFGSKANGFGRNGANSPASRFTDAASNKYLPPFRGNNALNGNGFGSGKPGVNGAEDATSNKYLPPFAGGSQGPNSQYGQKPGAFGSQPGFRGQPSITGRFGQPEANSQNGQASNGQFGQNGQYNGQRGQANQYRPGAQQDVPQQAFDEETGYHY